MNQYEIFDKIVNHYKTEIGSYLTQIRTTRQLFDITREEKNKKSVVFIEKHDAFDTLMEVLKNKKLNEEKYLNFFSNGSIIEGYPFSLDQYERVYKTNTTVELFEDKKKIIISKYHAQFRQGVRPKVWKPINLYKKTMVYVIIIDTEKYHVKFIAPKPRLKKGERRGNVIQYLSFKNLKTFSPLVGKELTKMLLSLNPNNEYIQHIKDINITENYFLSNPERRKITNTRDLLTKLSGKNCPKELSKKSFSIALSILKTHDGGDLTKIINFYYKLDEMLKKDDSKFLPNLEMFQNLSVNYNERKLSNEFLTNEFRNITNHDVTFNLSNNDSITKAYILYNILETIKTESDFHLAKSLVSDYIILSKDINLKIKTTIKSFRRLKEEHDEVAKIHRITSTPEIKVNEIFYDLFKNTDNLEFELIETRERLVEESVKMSHCVSTRASSINNNKAAIYSILDTNNDNILTNRSTLQLNYENGKFRKYELRGYKNNFVSEHIENIINKQIEEINKNPPTEVIGVSNIIRGANPLFGYNNADIIIQAERQEIPF